MLLVFSNSLSCAAEAAVSTHQDLAQVEARPMPRSVRAKTKHRAYTPRPSFKRYKGAGNAHRGIWRYFH
ncbi:hypothetical protein [Hymenobacter sp. B81]|uniref:hypothetical protein n=1 Tax=Hymenobacter sp. B81 TaxID=3344878 RepID=UPI0037DD8424